MPIPSVSVIMPAYNAEPYLRAAIESVLAQSLKDWELIICNDGSTDGTAAICEWYAAKESRIRLLSLGWNQGSSAARNRAVGESRGRYIAMMDADDECHPDRLAIQLEWARRHPNQVIMAGFSHNGVKSRGCDLYLPSELANAGLWAAVTICGSTMFLPRSIFEEIGGFDVAIPDSEDIDFVLRAGLAGYSFLTVPQELYYYRLHETSLTGRDRVGAYRRINAYETRMWHIHHETRTSRYRLFQRAMRGLAPEQWRGRADHCLRRKAAAVAQQLALRLHSLGDWDLGYRLLSAAARVCWWRGDAWLNRLILPLGLGLHITSFGDRRLPRLAILRKGEIVGIL